MAVSQTLSVTEVSGSVNTTNNTSKVRILWQSTQTGESWNGYTKTAKYYISVNGGSELEYSVSYTLPQSSTVTIVDKTVTVAHKGDGTGTVKVRTWMDTGISAGVVEKIETLNLTTIPRASTIDYLACATKYFTGKLTYKYTPRSSSYYNRCNISLNLNGNYIAVKRVDLGKKSASQQTATVTLTSDELATIYNELPSTTKGTLRFTFRTYSDSGYATEIGDHSYKELTLYIPNDTTTKPSLSYSLTPVSSLSGDFASLYLQGLSKVKATITTEGKYKATIKSTKMEVEGKSYDSGDSYTSDYLSGYGSLSVKVTTTDSRGYSQSVTKTITVISYAKPKVIPASGEKSIICARCDKDGNLTDSGTYLKIKAKRSYSKCVSNGEQKNFCGLRYRYKKVTDSSYSSWKTILIYSNLNTEEITTVQLDGALSVTASYIVQVDAVDSLGNHAYASFDISTEKIYLDRAGSRRSLGIGKYAEEDNVIDVADDITLKLGGNVAEAIASTSKADISGSVKYAGGLLIQWGNVTITPSAENTPTVAEVTYPIPYKYIPFVVVNPATTVPGKTVTGACAASVTATKFDATLTRTNLSQTHIRWLAIGFCEQ